MIKYFHFSLKPHSFIIIDRRMAFFVVMYFYRDTISIKRVGPVSFIKHSSMFCKICTLRQQNKREVCVCGILVQVIHLITNCLFALNLVRWKNGCEGYEVWTPFLLQIIFKSFGDLNLKLQFKSKKKELLLGRETVFRLPGNAKSKVKAI